MFMRRVRQREKDVDTSRTMYDLEAFADHAVRFALAGIAEIRGQIGERNEL